MIKKEASAEEKSNEGNSSNKKPTVIIKSQQIIPENDKEEPNQMNSMFDHPDFLIELKDCEIPGPFTSRRSSSSFNLSSPGFYFNSPGSNPFGFMQSPSTPKAYDYNHIGCLRPMQSSVLD